jgi:hypothetical protein
MAEALAVFIWTVRSEGGSPADYRVAYLQAGEPIYMGFAKNDAGKRGEEILTRASQGCEGAASWRRC